MARITLKEKYQSKKEILFETIILEEFNKELMGQATNIFKSLQAINFSSAGLKSFASARDAAVRDVDAVLANKSERGLIRKFIGLFKNKNENPLLHSLAFCDALQNFFEVFIQYLNAKKTGIEDTDVKKIKDIILGTTLPRNNQDTSEKLKTFEDLIKNGLQATGILKKLLGNTWQQKYLKNNYKGIAQEILNSNVKSFEEVANNVLTNIKNVDAVAQSAVGATQAAAKQTTSTTGTEPSQSTQSTGGTTPTQKTNNSNTGSPSQSKETKQALAVADKVYSDISTDFEGLDAETVKKVIAILAHNDKVKQ